MSKKLRIVFMYQKYSIFSQAVTELNARMAELVDAHDSNSCIERCVGSIPTSGTTKALQN